MSEDFEPVGVFPALPTPISEDGSINYETSANHIEYLENNGVHGVVPAGCTGHAATLGDRQGENLYDEHVEYIKRVSETADSYVIAGDGMNSTNQTIDLAQRIEEEADIDAHLMISPYQNCPPQDRIVSHYEEIADNVDEDIIAYNVPGRTGVNMTAETTMELAEIPEVVGIKEASLDYQQIRTIGKEIQHQDIDGFNLGSGDDAANDHVFEQGGTFTISVTANVLPGKTVDVWEAGYVEDDSIKAYDLNRELEDMHQAMFQDGEKNPMSVQEALNQMGFDFGTPRPPLDRRPREENRNEISEALESHGLI